LLEKLFDSYAMHSFEVGDICIWNGASSQALNQGYKFLLEE